MMEWVDMRDLRSLGHCGRAGSSPVRGTLKQKRLDKKSNLFLYIIT